MADDQASAPQSDATDASVLNDIATNGNLLNQNISALTQAVGSLTSIVLPVTNGGTGLDHVGVGDLLVGDTDNTYSLLSDIATGNALISGGVGAQPSWGKIGLTTHVSGVLPVPNGGTGRSSTTAYAVLCGGTSTTGALQPVASAGTAGQLLVSNGAAALPSFQTWADGIGWVDRFPLNGTVNFWLVSPFAFTITSTSTICTAGTGSISFAINGVAVAGGANSVSTSLNTVSRTSSNAVSAGSSVSWTISGVSGLQNMTVMVAITRP